MHMPYYKVRHGWVPTLIANSTSSSTTTKAYTGYTLLTVIPAWPDFTVRPGVGGQTENTGCVVLSIVPPTCLVGTYNHKVLWFSWEIQPKSVSL